MPRRAASPAPSENEVDILGSLYADDLGNTGHADDLDINGILGDTGADDGYDQDDEAFIALEQAASFRKSSNLQGRTVKKGGGFQAMGLSGHLLRAITRKGFSVPTPIQRKTIPLILDRKDVVGMARTGSGKTAAFVIPMIERLKAHSTKVGARAIILSPSRELALQTLKTVREFGKATDLRTILLVGGDSLEQQFGGLTSNPDILIATPGRLLHLKVEMSLDLSSVQYLILDEADRMLEQGFATQLTELLHSLPPSRQTCLFSATLPSSLVELARSGLQDPALIRLDADSKVSPELSSAFFSVKGAEKEGAILHILQDIIHMPVGLPAGAQPETDVSSKKRKRGQNGNRVKEAPTEHATIVFAATKHAVEYLAQLLQQTGYAVSYIFGSLDQTARRIQMDDFRAGRTNLLIVTDLAARGLDIPVLPNVINYDFPAQPKIFVHRVGRTARAGQKGWSYSLVRDSDAPYLLDLQLFLGKRMVLGQEGGECSNYATDVVVGALPRGHVEPNVEWLHKALSESADLTALRTVAEKAERQYFKTRPSASTQSAKRSREVVASRGWWQLHPLCGEGDVGIEQARDAMLARISDFKPPETIFEVSLHGRKGTRNEIGAGDIMKAMRQKAGPRKRPKMESNPDDLQITRKEQESSDGETESSREDGDAAVLDSVSDSDQELEVTVSNSTGHRNDSSWKDSEVFMSYTTSTTNAAEERGYSIHSGTASSNFVEAARDVTMDLINDEGSKSFGVPTRSKMRWDKKQSKYVARANDEDGSHGTKGPKMIRGESGVKIAASFQSGRFDRWRRANRLGKLPRVGEAEKSTLTRQMPSGVRYKHNREQAPREADKYRDDYHVRKKRVSDAREKRVGKFKDGEGSRKELKNATDIRKDRKIKELRKAKNARGSSSNRGKSKGRR